LADVHPEARIALVLSAANDRAVVQNFINTVLSLDLNKG
jgi:hypothetical protein